MKTLTLIVAVLTLSGCASSDYGQYVKAQTEANKLAAEGQKPTTSGGC